MFKRIFALFAARAGTADRADALSGGQQVGSANQPVYFGADGKPVAGNQIPVVHDTTLTIAASDWVGNEAPYTCTKTVSGMTADKYIIVAADPTLTATQRSALRSAAITCVGQDTDTLTFVADGTKPTEDLSIQIREM